MNLLFRQYRFNGGMGLAGTGATLTRQREEEAMREAAAARRTTLGGAGSYATLASFANVPYASSQGSQRNAGTGGRSQQQQQQRVYDSANGSGNGGGGGGGGGRWVNHYGSNQSSIWSSSQTMTSTMRGGTVGRSANGPSNQERSSSQSTIFGRRPPPDPTPALEPDRQQQQPQQQARAHPQQVGTRN